MGTDVNLKLSALFACAEMLPKTSDLLTPQVNCVYSVKETEGYGDIILP